MSPEDLLTMAHNELRQSVYWSARARGIKSGPLGSDSESYIAAVQNICAVCADCLPKAELDRPGSVFIGPLPTSEKECAWCGQPPLALIRCGNCGHPLPHVGGWCPQ